jgi:hypothetical protein
MNSFVEDIEPVFSGEFTSINDIEVFFDLNIGDIANRFGYDVLLAVRRGDLGFILMIDKLCNFYYVSFDYDKYPEELMHTFGPQFKTQLITTDGLYRAIDGTGAFNLNHDILTMIEKDLKMIIDKIQDKLYRMGAKDVQASSIIGQLERDQELKELVLNWFK